jgi:hypothetical protein
MNARAHGGFRILILGIGRIATVPCVVVTQRPDLFEGEMSDEPQV